MSRTILKGGMNRYRSNPNHMGTQWDDVLSFSVSVVKNPCLFPLQQDAVFTEEEVDEINKWLTSPDYPILFHMYDYDYKDSELESCIAEDDYGFHKETFWTSHMIYSDHDFTNDYDIMVGTESLISEMPESGYYKIIWDNKTYYCDVKYNDDFGYYIGNLDILREPFETYVDTGEPFVVLQSDGIFKAVYELNSGSNVIHSISAEYSPKKQYHLTNYDYYGLFSNVTPQIVAGDVIGFDMVFTTNSPFAWTHLKSETFYCNNQQDDGVEIHLRVDHSEQNREIYPVIAIKNRAGKQNVEIKCQTDNAKVMRLDVNGGTDTTVIDCRRAMIYDSRGLFSYDDLGIADVDYIYWPKLYDGLNRIIICGELLEVTIQWREARKVGAY